MNKDEIVSDLNGMWLEDEADRRLIRAASNLIQAQAQSIEALIDALEPFAKEAEQWAGFGDEDYIVREIAHYNDKLQVGHLREAKIALSKAIPPKEGE